MLRRVLTSKFGIESFAINFELGIQPGVVKSLVVRMLRYVSSLVFSLVLQHVCKLGTEPATTCVVLILLDYISAWLLATVCDMLGIAGTSSHDGCVELHMCVHMYIDVL